MELGPYHREVIAFLRDHPRGVVQDQLLDEFPGCPIKALESSGVIMEKDGKWFAGKGVN